MGEAADRFRARAKQCRELAAAARHDHSRRTLSHMAMELDAEATAIDAEEAARRNEN
jgi:hypothetical protein